MRSRVENAQVRKEQHRVARRCRALWAPVALIAAACGGGGPGGAGVPGAPPPPPKGRPISAVAVTIGSEGGSLSLAGPGGETLTVSIPPRALAAPTSITLEGITMTAVGAIDAFRLGPSGVQLALPLTLAWTMPAGTAPDQVTAAFQSPSGYWLRVYAVSRTAAVLSLETSSMGDWSLVTLSTSRDLQGIFRLDSTETARFTVTGSVTLQWIGDEGVAFAYYLPQGDLTVSSPISKGAASCTPVQPATAALPASIAEIRYLPTPVQFRWGINGRWDLTCSDATSPSISTDFDSLGITNTGCARSYLGSYTIANDHVQGQYLIDCSAQPGGYRVAASWDLVPPGAVPGPLPSPPF